jgi:hypothetical protein
MNGVFDYDEKPFPKPLRMRKKPKATGGHVLMPNCSAKTESASFLPNEGDEFFLPLAHDPRHQ